MPDKDSDAAEQPFKRLVGEQFSAVCFVQDYVQFQFSNGAVLTALTWPVIHKDVATSSYGMPNYRDSLCEMITKTIRRGSAREGEEIRIEFDDDSALTVSLKEEERSVAEAAILDSKPDEWWSW